MNELAFMIVILIAWMIVSCAEAGLQDRIYFTPTRLLVGLVVTGVYLWLFFSGVYTGSWQHVVLLILEATSAAGSVYYTAKRESIPVGGGMVVWSVVLTALQVWLLVAGA